MQADTRNRIEEALSAHRIVLFMKGNKTFPQCGFSARVVEVLKRAGADFHAINVLADPEIRDGIKEFSDWPTIPQLYIDEKFIGGCDIVTDLERSGELTRLLAGGS